MKNIDQERKAFESFVLSEGYFSESDLVWNGVDEYDCIDADDAFRIWQAARRVQVVPDGWRESLTELVAAMRKYEMDVDGIAPAQHRAMMRRAELLLAAAPQPPEAVCITCNGHGAVGNITNAEPCPDCTPRGHLSDAAPVQLPEPWGKEFGDGAWYNLYTEHQVRQLLAQHGIK